MSEIFHKLEREKQERIIKAALKEFAEKGYEQASTNRIVKYAGIGKGMLFYYFNSKKELFHYLVNYTLDKIIQEYLEQIDDEIEDVIDRLAHIAQLKLKFYKENIELNQFLATFHFAEQVELPEELQKKFDQVIKTGTEKVYANKKMDYRRFREDVDPEKAYQLIEWALKGYQADMVREFQGKKINNMDLTPLWDEFDEYLAILKKCFYK